jgi:ABC-type multidrug transport system fused ATPase/permease subunit
MEKTFICIDKKMLFKRICKDYINKNKGLYFGYIAISTLSYVTKIIITPMIYSNILNLKEDNTFLIISQIFKLWIFMGIIYIVKIKIENNLFSTFLSFARQYLFRLFLEKNQTNFNDSSVTSDINRILEVTRYMKEIFAWISQYILPISLSMICINGYFLYKLPIMGVINIFSNIIMISYINNNYKKLIDDSIKRENSYSHMVKKLDENFNNLLNIYLNNQVEKTISENEKIENDYKDIYIKQNETVSHFISNIKIINYIFIMICIYILSKKSKDKQNFINIILIFTFYLSTIEGLIEDVPFIIMTIGNINYAEPFLENTLKKEIRESYIPNFEGNIKVDNISFKYENSPYLFENFSLDIKKGERIVIIGKTGKGKSTLVKILLDFYNINKGNIYLDGINYKDIPIEEIRKNINYINQKTILFNDTILNNIKYGNDKTDKDIINFLQKYQLDNIFYDINKIIEKNGSMISMGMQKVIFLVRGILKNSPVIIFDEPFSGIDQNTRKLVLHMIDEETKDKTVIIITHDLEGIEDIIDKIIEL